MGVEQYNLVAHDWLNLEFIINDLANRVIGQELSPGSSPTWAGITITGKLAVGSQASPVDVTSTRQHGFELHYSGNNYDVTGIRSRAQLVTTDTIATAQGALLQAANNDGIDVGVLNGALIEAIGKSSATAATISTMRGALIGTEWGVYDTITELKTLHVRGHSLNAAGAGSFGTGYGIYIENEAVGGNGQAYDAGIYFKDTNLSAGNKAFTYGIDFSGGTFGSEEIKLANGSVIGSDSVVLAPITDSTTFFQIKDAVGAMVANFDTVNKRWGFRTATPEVLFHLRVGGGALQSPRENVVAAFQSDSSVGDSPVVQIIAGTSGISAIEFGDTDDGDRGRLRYVHPVDEWRFTSSVGDVLTIERAGNVGFGGENAPETLTEWTSIAPYLTLHNSTHEDTDDGGESRLIFKREDGAGTETACAQIEASHDGVIANNQLGKLQLSVNMGTGLVDVVEIDSSGNTKIGDAGTTNYTEIEADGSISQVGTARIDWTKITANGVTIRNAHGTTSDTVSDLQTAHDGNFYTLSEESGETPGMDIEVDFTGVTAFNWIQILARYEQAVVSHGITVMLEITPFNGSVWHRYDYFSDQGADLTNENHSFFVPDDSAYINSGVVKVRFVHEMIGTSSNHDLVIDVCALYQ